MYQQSILTERLLFWIGPNLKFAFTTTSTLCREFINFGSKVIINVCFVGIESSSLSDDCIAIDAEAIEWEFESDDAPLEVLVVLGLWFVAPRVEGVGWDVVAIGLGCGEGGHSSK